ncbi:Oligosaccaryltransferase-domain-containing protein [Aspergillus karnatakaensis]|uniref:dolichyl-diphosphooligosaccharide--protein glycosyltransferase subunit 4 n=1 Tax=Aspergillus karnatakaensis TaxID=1810916 RepID=UPI003CCDA02F
MDETSISQRLRSAIILSLTDEYHPTIYPKRRPFLNTTYTFRTYPIAWDRIRITMITDNELHRLAVFLGSVAMLLIVLYHFLEVNAKEDDEGTVSAVKAPGGNSKDSVSRTTATATAGGPSAATGAKDR